MADEIGLMLNKISLERDDDDIVTLNDNTNKGVATAVNHCLVGKMIMKKLTNLKVMKSMLSRVWQRSDVLDVQEVGDRMWIFLFSSIKDKRKVLYRQPWSFNRGLIIFWKFDGELTFADYDFS